MSEQLASTNQSRPLSVVGCPDQKDVRHRTSDIGPWCTPSRAGGSYSSYKSYLSYSHACRRRREHPLGLSSLTRGAFSLPSSDPLATRPPPRLLLLPPPAPFPAPADVRCRPSGVTNSRGPPTSDYRRRLKSSSQSHRPQRPPKNVGVNRSAGQMASSFQAPSSVSRCRFTALDCSLLPHRHTGTSGSRAQARSRGTVLASLVLSAPPPLSNVSVSFSSCARMARWTSPRAHPAKVPRQSGTYLGGRAPSSEASKHPGSLSSLSHCHKKRARGHPRARFPALYCTLVFRNFTAASASSRAASRRGTGRSRRTLPPYTGQTSGGRC